METSTIPPEVLQRIQSSSQRFGQFDWKGNKYVFCPNNNNGGVNPTHIFDLRNKTGALTMEGKISFLGKIFIHQGKISHKGGETAVFIYQVVEQWSKEKKIQVPNS